MKKKTVLKDLRAKEAKLSADLAEVRKQIRAEEARQANVQGNGLGEMMRKRYAELHPDANLDDLTPEEIFELVLADQKAKPPVEQKTEPEAFENAAGDLVSTDAEVEMPEEGELSDSDAEEAADDGTPEQPTFRF